MERTNIYGSEGAGQSRLLAIGILYFLLAGASIFSQYAYLIWMAGLPLNRLMIITGILGVITLACTIAVLILLLNVGKVLERKLVLVAGFIALTSLVATFALNFVYLSARIPVINQFIDAGLADMVGEPFMVEMYADFFTSGIIVRIPLSVFPVLLSVCLLLDASKGGLNRAIPIVAIALAGTAASLEIAQVCSLWYGLSWNNYIPISQAVTALWGVYFIVARYSLRGPRYAAGA